VISTIPDIMVVNLRAMHWARHVAGMGAMRNVRIILFQDIGDKTKHIVENITVNRH
jgi:hypothetical protein